jgi:hypothetical protein
VNVFCEGKYLYYARACHSCLAISEGPSWLFAATFASSSSLGLPSCLFKLGLYSAMLYIAIKNAGHADNLHSHHAISCSSNAAASVRDLYLSAQSFDGAKDYTHAFAYPQKAVARAFNTVKLGHAAIRVPDLLDRSLKTDLCCASVARSSKTILNYVPLRVMRAQPTQQRTR